jgi:hypothetical protein
MSWSKNNANPFGRSTTGITSTSTANPFNRDNKRSPIGQNRGGGAMSPFKRSSTRHDTKSNSHSYSRYARNSEEYNHTIRVTRGEESEVYEKGSFCNLIPSKFDISNNVETGMHFYNCPVFIVLKFNNDCIDEDNGKKV